MATDDPETKLENAVEDLERDLDHLGDNIGDAESKAKEHGHKVTPESVEAAEGEAEGAS